MNAAVEDINANENADAPKTKARECLAPKAILPQPVDLSLGSGWRAPLITRLLAGYQFFAIEHPARIAFILVTPRCGTGQQCDGALYIDCKVQRLDCASIELYNSEVGNL